MADKKIVPTSRQSVDDDLVSETPKTTSSKPSNSMAVNATSAGNTKDGANTGEAILKGIGFSPVPNPLSDFHQSTYHISFYLDSDIPSEQDKDDTFIIAETGLTGMNLQEVTISQMVGPSIRTKNAMATDITIRIYEPGGALLPDLLYQAAARKQIRNYLKAPWFLKLKLRGIDDQGEPMPVGEGWRWKLMLIDVQTKVDELGAMHTITAMPLSEVALNDQYCMLGTSVTTRKSQTIRDALNETITRMNYDAEFRYGKTSVPFVQYAVEDRPYGFDTKVGVNRPLDHAITSTYPQGSNQTTADGYDVQAGQFAPGTDFPAVVDQLMSRSETAVKMIRASRELPPACGDDNEDVIKDVFSVAHRIETVVEYGEYNEYWGDYSKKITYVIKPYTTLRLLTSRGRALKYDREKTFNRLKAEYAVKNSFMKKQYDYLFTGMNTEVLNFDINLNFSWAVSVPQKLAQDNTTGTPAVVDPNASAAELQVQSAEALQKLRSAEQALNDFKQTTVDRIDVDSDGKKDGKSKGGLTEADNARARALGLEIKLAQERVENLSRMTGAAIDRENRKAPPRRLLPEDQGRIVDGEDLVYQNAMGRNRDGSENRRYMGADQGGSSIMPVTIAQNANNPGQRTYSGTSSDNGPNKGIYGALLNQLYGSIDGNLQDIDLEIRGDPYWLGHADPNLIYDEISNDTTPNFFNGEHIFVFRFKLPVGYDPNTGSPQVQTDATMSRTGGNSNIFTGFFAAYEVLHKFSNGAFTQSLKGTRIPGWTYENIIEGREANISDSTVYNNEAGPTSPQVTSRPSTVNGTTGSTGFSGGFDPQALMAITMVQEAGNQGLVGMQAVGNVIVNRSNAGGGDISAVIKAPSQFSAWNNVDPRRVWEAKKNTAVYQQAYQIAGNVLNNRVGDVTGGATAYLNPVETRKLRQRAGQGYTLPSWYYKGTITKVIGNHTFLKGVYRGGR